MEDDHVLGDRKGNTSRKSGFTQLPLIWKSTIVLLSLLCVILLILVIVGFTRSTRSSSEGKIAAKKTRSTVCKPSLKTEINTKIAGDSIFHDLTENELISVRDYILKQPSLNVTQFEKAGLNHNFIHMIELFLPDKNEAIQYLDNKRSKPERKARVILVQGANKSPSVVELLVSPVPNPNSHNVLQLNKRKTTIPYYARPFTWFETKNLLPLIKKATEEAYPLLKESFGYWMHNCTDKCLLWFPIAQPSRKEPGKRYSWVQFTRKLKGTYLFNVPMQFLVEYTSPNNIKLLELVYNDQKFNSASELMKSYTDGKLKMIHLKEPSDEIKLRATMKRRGDPMPSMPARGPTLVEPNGRRFSLRGNRVSYMNWRFDFGIRPTAGLGIFDVRFKGKRIAYEVSLQEGIAYYSGYDPETSNTHYIDSMFGLGSSNTPLMRGIDCPETAVYLDSFAFVQSNKPTKNIHSICIFETNPQMPLWRHFDVELKKETTGIEGMWSFGGMVDNSLVIRVVSTPFNYDYIFDYVLHQNGAIEVKTTPSGYINPAFYSQKEADYGFLSMQDMIGTIHDHFILYKVDLDVEGQKNTYQTVDVVAKNISYEWEANTYRIKKQVVKNKKKNEKDALLRYDFDKPKYLVFTNENKNNTYGQPKGYRIDIKSQCKQMYADDYWMNDVVAWTKYQLAVTKHNDKEPFGSSIFNQYSFLDPAFNFDSMINDNEAIENEDLVAWVTIGGLHIPNTEDIPMTTTAGGTYKFVIRPFGYFDEDPSMSSTNSALLDVEDHGKYKKYTYGTPEDATCPGVPKRKIW